MLTHPPWSDCIGSPLDLHRGVFEFDWESETVTGKCRLGSASSLTQARSRRIPPVLWQPGVPERREFAHRRHGTASYIAALDITSGEVGSRCRLHHRRNFIAFLEHPDRHIDPTPEIHLVLYNRASPCGQSHPGVAGRASPIHSSPHPQTRRLVEPGRAVLDPLAQTVKQGEFRSRDEMVDRVIGLHPSTHQHAKPCAWTYHGSPLKPHDPHGSPFCAPALGPHPRRRCGVLFVCRFS